MGLDISVNVTVKEVLQALKYDDCGVKDRAHAIEILANGYEDEDDDIHSGQSYSGIHKVRVAYSILKGWPLQNNGRHADPAASANSHLCNHEDNQGWYLPEDFTEPAWIPEGIVSTSVGSSVRLLAELEELQETRKALARGAFEGMTWGWEWDNIYIAAVASVVCRTPIKFH